MKSNRGSRGENSNSTAPAPSGDTGHGQPPPWAHRPFSEDWQPGDGPRWTEFFDWLDTWRAERLEHRDAHWSPHHPFGEDWQPGGGRPWPEPPTDEDDDDAAENNIINGTEFDDTLVGTSGKDILNGLGGNDLLIGNGDADALNGGDGTDTASYETAGSGVDASLNDGTGFLGDADGDTYSSIENLTGGNFDDTLIGDAGANRLSGLGGNDILSGLAGNDTLNGGAGADSLDGGAGTDTASYANAASGVDARLMNGTGTTGEAQGDSFTSIENLLGGNFNDILVGDNGVNTLTGGLGKDVLSARGGNDTLDGGSGNDTLNGGGGEDTLNGGAGTDTVSYSISTSGVDARLINGTGFAGEAIGDTFSSIENLIGGKFNDVLVGDNGTNVLTGRGGDDVLSALGGDDTLNGGTGNDLLFGGTGGDALFGGAGIDTASYSSAAAGVSADLNAGGGSLGEADGDTYSSIENLRGSSFGDVLVGNDEANTLNGRGGNDTLTGGAGNDILTGGNGNDLFVFNTGDGVDVITDFSAGVGSGDVILFDNSAAGPNNFAELQAVASQVGVDTVIDLGGGDSITLLGVNAGLLAADDFLF